MVALQKRVASQVASQVAIQKQVAQMAASAGLAVQPLKARKGRKAGRLLAAPRVGSVFLAAQLAVKVTFLDVDLEMEQQADP